MNDQLPIMSLQELSECIQRGTNAVLNKLEDYRKSSKLSITDIEQSNEAEFNAGISVYEYVNAAGNSVLIKQLSLGRYCVRTTAKDDGAVSYLNLYDITPIENLERYQEALFLSSRVISTKYNAVGNFVLIGVTKPGVIIEKITDHLGARTYRQLYLKDIIAASLIREYIERENNWGKLPIVNQISFNNSIK